VTHKDGTLGKLGSGGFRTAYSVDINLKDGSKKSIVAKLGFTHPREVELFKRWQGRNLVPETYGFIEGTHGGLLFQERVEAPTLRKVMESGDAFEKSRAAKAVAALDGSLAFSGLKTDADGNLLATHILDLGAENILIKDGRAIIVDADPKFLVSRPLHEYLAYMLVYRDIYFQGDEYNAYLARLRDVFVREKGESAGTMLFAAVLKKARAGIAQGGQFQLFSKYAGSIPDDVDAVFPDFKTGSVLGSNEYLRYISQGALPPGNQVGVDYAWDVRIPAAVDAFLASVGQ
ncbi:MAG: hypothetical protein Q8P02_01305, partial [Candidatus Micrarchaeota archaeon]|nr:hypothetical protein [Candidatus Micrarchaeota archaeon]